MTGPTHGSLFSGYEGAGLALESIWPDTQTRWVSDIEAGPRKVLAHRYPDAPNLGDITKIDWSQVEPVDIITGGSPCQDLSHAGKRAGMKPGTRSGLWASMHDAITIIKPRLVVWENVRGALSAEATTGDVESCEFCLADRDGQPMRALGRVLGDLAEIGYDAIWTSLRAADVGACHGRFRVFVVAWPADAESVGWEWRRASRSGWAGPADGDSGPLRLPTPRATDGTKGGPNQRGSSGDLMLPSAIAQLLPTPTVMDSASSGGKPLGVNVTLTDATVRLADTFGDYAKAIARQELAFGRPSPSPVEATGRGGANRLSPVFDEWLMGLPEGWITDVPDITRNEALRLCGNGIVPQQMAEAVRWCLEQRETLEERAA